MSGTRIRDSVAAQEGMASLPGGTFFMGSDEFSPEEQPVRETTVGAFAIDRHPVTVAEFRRFVADTGYVTLAERPPDPALYPDADPDLLVPGSLVFQRTEGPVRLDDVRAWWAYVPGACWTAPEGPSSSTRGRHRHPVTQIAYEDALAYAQWAVKDLLGVDEGPLRGSASEPAMLRPQPRSRRSARDRAPCDPRRIAPLRADLLPAVPPRGPTVRNRRHIDQPHRFSLRHASSGHEEQRGPSAGRR